MLIAQVVGTATSTIKHRSMEGCKLLVVQPLQADGRTPDGDPLVAIDRAIGAGVGERVILTSDGAWVRDELKVQSTPVRWMVLGIPDN